MSRPRIHTGVQRYSIVNNNADFYK